MLKYSFDHRNKLYFKVYYNTKIVNLFYKKNYLFYIFIIFHNIKMFCIFDQINAG